MTNVWFVWTMLNGRPAAQKQHRVDGEIIGSKLPKGLEAQVISEHKLTNEELSLTLNELMEKYPVREGE